VEIEVERAAADTEVHRSLVDQSPDMIVRVARDGKLTFASPASAALLGYEPEALLGRLLSSLVHHDDRVALAALEACRTSTRREVRLRHRDGRWIWTEQVAGVVLDDDGRVAQRQLAVRSIEARKQDDLALRESLQRYRALADNFPAGAVFLFDRDTRYLVATGAALPFLGVEPGSLEGKTPEEAFGGERGLRVGGLYREALAGTSRSWRDDHAGGRIFSISIAPVRDPAGVVIAGLAIAEDITERALDDEERAALHEIAQAVARSAGLPEVLEIAVAGVAARFRARVSSIVRFDTPEIGTILVMAPEIPEPLLANPIVPLSDRTATGLVSLTGRPAAVEGYDESTEFGAGLRSRGLNAGAAAPIRIRGELWGALAVAGSEQQWAGPVDVDRLGRFAELVAVAISNADAWDTLTRHAATDGVTGLANYRTFQERLQDEVERASRYDRDLSVVLFDLDHFKQINDLCGHQVGDQVLAETARRIEAQSRQGELVARTGGEEFAWILPEANAHGAFAAAERVRRAMEETPFAEAGRVTVSAGVCSLAESTGAMDLIRLADRALYRAKDAGRNVTRRHGEEPPAPALTALDGFERFQTMSGIRALARAIDAKDSSTRDHSERVAKLAQLIAAELDWSPRRINLLHAAGLLHDVGKIAVPDEILLKPGRLTSEEFDEIQRHAALGGQIVAEVMDEAQADWVRSHHERWDGNGYPDGLAGEAISDGAQILAVADAFDVMTTSRSYKVTLDHDDAMEECRREAGLQFSPSVVVALARLLERGVLG
jgi:diguanylate cyclase (GGDEF)-like protein/PAS domain S-box-containing protein